MQSTSKPWQGRLRGLPARAIAEVDIQPKEIGQLKIAIIESARKVGIDRAPRNNCLVSEAIRNQLPSLVRLLRYQNREARSNKPHNQKTHLDVWMAHPVV
jgi:hypothetical protein